MILFWVFFITVLFFMAVSFMVGRWIGKTGIAITELSLILPVLVYLRIKKIALKNVFHLKAVSAKFFIISIMIGLSYATLMDEFNRLLHAMVMMDDALMEGMRRIAIWNSWNDAIFLIAGVVICAPVCEELLVRGFIQGGMQKYYGMIRSLVLSAFCFMFIHFQPFYSIQFFLFGILSGLLFWKTGSVLPSICMHAFFNLYVILVNNTDTSHIRWYEFHNHVSPLCIAFAILLMYTAFKFLDIRNTDLSSET